MLGPEPAGTPAGGVSVAALPLPRAPAVVASIFRLVLCVIFRSARDGTAKSFR
jgi:hypothetical protein